MRPSMNYRRDSSHLLIALTVLAAAALRIWFAATKSFSHPEMSVPLIPLPFSLADPGMRPTLYDTFVYNLMSDTHPPGYYLFEWFGNSPAFLSPGWVFWTVCVIEILQWTPFALLLFHLAYSSIPADVREAARMDGARGWRTFRRVELPMLMPTLALAAVIRLIDGIRVFDNIYVLVGAGPGGSTTSLPIYIYTSFFRGGSLGPALAASVLFALAAFAGLFLALRAADRRAGA